jgi:integrase
MKTRTGYIYREGRRWVARVTHTDASGKRRNVKRYCENKTEARLRLRQLVRQLDERGEKAIEGDKMKFRDVARRYAETKLIEATYVGEKKVAGFRSLVAPKLYLKVLADHFGNKRIRSITHADIEAFKLIRLQTPTRHGTQRAVAAVNRELEMLRAVLNFARRQGWIAVNPFSQGESLIDRSSENSRDRVLSFEEEDRLLSVCVDRLAHLRPIVITAVDTGMRRGELFKLEWRDVDFDAGLIRLRAITTKTNKPREVAMTSRVLAELRQLWEKSPGEMNSTVFGITNNVKNGFSSACRKAGIENLRIHDLRHTFVSRVTAAGLQATEAMKLSGHATLAMLNRYLNVNSETARRAAEALDVYREGRSDDESSGLIN